LVEILVDSSVWIAALRGKQTLATAKLAKFGESETILVGDLILLEVLQGSRDDEHAVRIERDLRTFDVVALLDYSLAIKAAEHYRRLRALGVTIRKTIDLIIGTWCIEHGVSLLHEDRDFEPMERYLGLRVA
jgi:predicted nucleic acid-binding protein